MFNSFKKSGSAGKRKWIGRGLFFVFLIGLISTSLVFAQPTVVHAEKSTPTQAAAKGAADASTASCGNPSPGFMPCVGKAISSFISTVWDGIIGPATQMIAAKAIVDFASFAANRIAYESAMYIANGGPGEGSMFYKKTPTQAWKSFGKDMAGQAFADLSDITKQAFGLDLCTPPSPFIRINSQLSLKASYAGSYMSKPRCDFDTVSSNWQQVAADAGSLFENNPFDRDQFLYKKLEEGLRPGTNQLGATIGIFNLTNETAQKNAEQNMANYYASKAIGNIVDVRDTITGQTKTPAAILNDKMSSDIKDATDKKKDAPTLGDVLDHKEIWTGLLGMTVSTFTNTLSSQLFNRVYKGLFSPKPDTSTDPFNAESAGSTGSLASSKADLGSVFTASILPNPQYSVLDEFAQCPPDGISNRGLNQCVLDASVITAITRGDLTVQEAIDQKILNGDWPLISSENVAANSDRLCYTYGYCYGNLVKMRKARLVSIGWEMAANSPANKVSSPVTLSQVVDGFNKCNTQGQIDSANPWCHLIDPNWVLKAPETLCRAAANGEIRLASSVAGRQSACVDAPTCIGEDNSGKCVKGFGYCVEEKNIWRVRGDACDAQNATCLTLKNTFDSKEASYLLNTVDNAYCTKQNAGCAWFKTQKYLDNKGNTDPKDDSFEWLPSKDAYNVAARSSSMRYQIASNGTSARASFGGGTTNTAAYSSFAYEDRLYLTHGAKQCDQAQAGCTELNVKDKGLTLNLVQNGSFETDEDKNGTPDGWMFEAQPMIDSTTSAIDGKISLHPASGGDAYQVISVNPGSFYTFSLYAYALASGTTSLSVEMTPLTDANTKLTSLAGLTYSSSTCQLVTDHYEFNASQSNVVQTDGWKRFVCTFTLPAGATKLEIRLNNNTTMPDYDAVQLESGELASSITNGYSNSSPTKAYLKVAPAYLGCKGLSSDPAECSNFAQVCSALDVGCNLFTPEVGPAVPAIASAVDACPNECVGYDSYRQEKTLYEPAKFPSYFIASSAATCSAQAVGCDGFTALGAQGGEKQEYYTALRACLTPTMAVGSDKTSAVYFTWEGSDTTGYQLQTWQLLKSNAPSTQITFTNSQVVETDPSKAPCTKFTTTNTDVSCVDDAARIAQIVADTTCESHADIFTNPDCREFFDKDGNIHYRKYSQTISIDAACTPYRKDVSTSSDCTVSGGFWNTQGFCRYFALPKESNVCTAAENGCRMFTGGAGRNATTILSEDFEGGTVGDFVNWKGAGATAQLIPSNDSVSTGGKSLKVIPQNSGHSGFQTAHAFYDNANHNTTCPTDGGCQKTECKIDKGSASCGALVSSLVKGKVYTLQFWAKGKGNIYAGFFNAGGTGTWHDFVDPANTGNLKPFALTNAWSVYHLGPINTAGFTNFDQNSVLTFFANAGDDFFIDNISLTQTEENITLIKDSWVTPATCDQSPDGAANPQYYLGCKAYTDRKSVKGSYYQFSHVCSEKAIGCSAYYNTSNSDSPYSQVSNARCVNLGTTATTYDPVTGGVQVANTTPCVVNGATYCTIPTNEKYCVFSTNQAFQDPLPVDTSATNKFAVVYGPETVVTKQDQAAYLVDNGAATCVSSFKGCREVAAPVYEQDQKTVKSFTSTYVMDSPQEYGNILCENKALRCEEYSTGKDGNFYFKDPLDKTCEYKTSITIGTKNFSGWFRTGKNEPCYYTDNSSPLNAKFDLGIDTAYLVAGDQSEMWKNGDTAYDGWVGACDSSANRCTELIDKTDTSPENHGKGKSYYVINNDKLSENVITSTAKCNGLVGQKAGCALFNNTTNSQQKYSSSASYVLSLHADLLLRGKHQNDLVDPISCTQNGGTFTISTETAKKLEYNDNQILVEHVVHDPSVLSVDLCERRCVYELPANDSLITPSATNEGATTLWNERSCLFTSDCPVLTSRMGNKLSGDCRENGFRVRDDANTVLKVNRDRTCASWLYCNSSRAAWDQKSNKYINICDSINLCNQAGSQADQTSCQSPSSRLPLVMTPQLYASRDVSWAGTDFSGYEIPNQLPVEKYTQVNLNPKKWCDNNHVKSCSSKNDCGINVDCVEAPQDFRLVYNAGRCNSTDSTTPTPSGAIPYDGVNGSECKIGVCENSGTACRLNTDCSGSSCVFGYCKHLSATACDDDSICGTNKCDLNEHLCETAVATAVSDSGSCSGAGNKYVLASTTITGSCYQDRCLTDIKAGEGGVLKKLDSVQSDNVQSCRGYPEIDSPFPQKVVTNWEIKTGAYNLIKAESKGVDAPVNGLSIVELKNATSNAGSPIAAPSKFVSGYDGSKVCSPICDASGCHADNSCLCSYTKATYAKGTETRYYAVNAGGEKIPTGICTGGLKEGLGCNTDEQCTVPAVYPTTGNPPVPDTSKPPTTQAIIGNCQHLTSTSTMYGWQGYCLEKDSTIQLNGSTEAKDQACLTWLPVDQLSGATDLYGKDMGAGYPLKNTYYCAEASLTWDLKTTGVACAENTIADNPCDDEDPVDNDSELVRAAKEDGAYTGVYCPPAYFAIMVGCGDANNNSMCTQGLGDDYPYFCVPKASYKADKSECVAPTAKLVELTSVFNTKIYLTNKAQWDAAITAYKSCEVKGILQQDISNYVGGTYAASPSSIPSALIRDQSGTDIAKKLALDAAASFIPGVGLVAIVDFALDAFASVFFDFYYYYGFSPNLVSYPSCKSVVQVSGSTTTGDVNAAWTNRLWNNDLNTFSLIPNSTLLSYMHQTANELFGSAIDPSTKNTQLPDPDPIRIATCQDGSSSTLLPVNGKCPGVSKPTLNEARSFDLFSVGGGAGISGGFNVDNAKARLIQIFAESYGTKTFDSFTPSKIYGGYQDSLVVPGTVSWDVRATANVIPASGSTPAIAKPPVITSVGNCVGTDCFEKNDGKISVNSQDTGDIQGTGSKHMNVTFFARADKNQMPLRKIIIDWGDSSVTGANSQSWPIVENNWGGSNAPDNFYKNHRGQDPIHPSKNLCDSLADDKSDPIANSSPVKYNPLGFAGAPEACSASYVLFNHDYVCTANDVTNTLKNRICKRNGTRLLNSPCIEPDPTNNNIMTCVFQPRVHAKDNWGWCTGYCNANPTGGETTNSCFGDKECDISKYPSDGVGNVIDVGGKVVNPWINYDGVIRIKPIQ